MELVTFSLHGKGVPPELATVEMAAEGASIGALIECIIKAKPALGEFLTAKGKVRTDITILINGRHCMFMVGLETKLSELDRVDVLLPMIGG
jgi:molybdopterin converting factor small subunit